MTLKTSSLNSQLPMQFIQYIKTAAGLFSKMHHGSSRRCLPKPGFIILSPYTDSAAPTESLNKDDSGPKESSHDLEQDEYPNECLDKSDVDHVGCGVNIRRQYRFDGD